MGINVLITAGGTAEPIDRVRFITNFGTGKLGCLVAERLSEYDNVDTIFHVHSRGAYRPVSDKVVDVQIGSAEDLAEMAEKLAKTEKIDAVVHSMAVSDYRVRSVTTMGTVFEVAQEAADEEHLTESLTELDARKIYTKVPSNLGAPVLVLERTPKIIPMFRELLPEAVIMGFKLLDSVSEEHLIDVSYELLKKNRCDYVLANDYATVSAGVHKGYLLDAERNYASYVCKEDIAVAIARVIAEGRK